MKHSASERHWWILGVLGEIPADAVLVSVLTVAASAVVLLTELTALRAVLGLPLLLFFPGYALLTVLFPVRRSTADGLVDSDGSLADGARFALSFGMSLTVLPVVAVVLWSVWGGVDTQRVVMVYCLGTILGMTVGAVRRARIPEPIRYEPPFKRWMHVARSWLLPVGAAGLVNVALGVAVLVAVAAGTAALVVPVEPASSYTGFSVLTQQSDGSYVANGYPTTVDVGEEIELVAGIENHEVGPVSYTVVVELQRVSIQDGTARAAYVSELTRFETTVEAGETRYVTHRVRPTLRGENLRLVYYLYEGEVPADPSAENAYRSLQLWIDVGVPDDTDAGSTESA